METEQMPSQVEPVLTQPPSEEKQVVEPKPLATTTAEEGAETPEEGKEEAEQEEQRLELPEGWQDAEDAKAWRQEAHDEGFKKAQSIKDREALERDAQHAEEIERVSGVIQASQAVKDLTNVANAIIKDLKEVPGTSAEAITSFKQLVDENEKWAELLSNEKQTVAQEQGRVEGISLASEMMQEALPKEMARQLGEFVNQKSLEYRAQKVTVGAAYKQIVGKLIEIVRADEEAKVEKMVSERKDQEARAEKREGEKPAVKVDGRGATGSRRYTRTQLSKMTREELAQVPREERDRAMAAP